MNYTSSTGTLLSDSHETDLGIDLPCPRMTIIPPFEWQVIDTGISMEFPIFGKLRRIVTRILFGAEIVGIGGLIWPRGRHDTLIMAGVVDPGYRGTIKVKVFNPNRDKIVFEKGQAIAQLVPVICTHSHMRMVTQINKDTLRGTSGGINVRTNRSSTTYT